MAGAEQELNMFFQLDREGKAVQVVSGHCGTHLMESAKALFKFMTHADDYPMKRAQIRLGPDLLRLGRELYNYAPEEWVPPFLALYLLGYSYDEVIEQLDRLFYITFGVTRNQRYRGDSASANLQVVKKEKNNGTAG